MRSKIRSRNRKVRSKVSRKRYTKRHTRKRSKKKTKKKRSRKLQSGGGPVDWALDHPVRAVAGGIVMLLALVYANKDKIFKQKRQDTLLEEQVPTGKYRVIKSLVPVYNEAQLFSGRVVGKLKGGDVILVSKVQELTEYGVQRLFFTWGTFEGCDNDTCWREGGRPAYGWITGGYRGSANVEKIKGPSEGRDSPPEATPASPPARPASPGIVDQKPPAAVVAAAAVPPKLKPTPAAAAVGAAEGVYPQRS